MFKELPDGYRHLELPQVGSTNQVALEYAQNQDGGKLWITASRQLQGKGSRGRTWVSEPGNLFASLLLRNTIKAERLATLTFVASLAVYDALTHFVDEERLSLKWPNDVLMTGAKISGILLENHLQKNQDAAIIIGIGINCAHNPKDTTHIATNIHNSGVKIEPNDVFQILVTAMDKWLNVWDFGNNFTDIRSAWLQRAKGLGSEIIVQMPNGQRTGIFEDLDHNGCLILKTQDNVRHKISTADIFFPENN